MIEANESEFGKNEKESPPRTGKGNPCRGLIIFHVCAIGKASFLYNFIREHYLAHKFENYVGHTLDDFDALYALCSGELLELLDPRLELSACEPSLLQSRKGALPDSAMCSHVVHIFHRGNKSGIRLENFSSEVGLRIGILSNALCQVSHALLLSQ